MNDHDFNGDTPFHLATMNGHLEICKLLVSYGADVNIQNANGDTPLHIAAKHQNVDIFEELMFAKNIDLSLKNNEALTAKQIARRFEKMKYIWS